MTRLPRSPKRRFGHYARATVFAVALAIMVDFVLIALSILFASCGLMDPLSKGRTVALLGHFFAGLVVGIIARQVSPTVLLLAALMVLVEFGLASVVYFYPLEHPPGFISMEIVGLCQAVGLLLPATLLCRRSS